MIQIIITAFNFSAILTETLIIELANTKNFLMKTSTEYFSGVLLNTNMSTGYAC